MKASSGVRVWVESSWPGLFVFIAIGVVVCRGLLGGRLDLPNHRLHVRDRISGLSLDSGPLSLARISKYVSA